MWQVLDGIGGSLKLARDMIAALRVDRQLTAVAVCINGAVV